MKLFLIIILRMIHGLVLNIINKEIKIIMIDTLDLQKYFKDPIDYNCRTLFNHLGRYFYAMQKLKITKKDVVMDCSCGQGYGSYNLALNAKRVFAIDINKEYLEKAKENFKLKNLFFWTYGNAFKGLHVDKIVCLETIEHLKDIYEMYFFIDKIYKCLTDKGQIFLSFPIGKNRASEYNKFHLCEPSIESMYNIMKKHFNRIEFEVSKFVNNYDKECEYCYMWGSK